MRTIPESRKVVYRRRRRRVDRRHEGFRSGGLPRRTGDGGREEDVSSFAIRQYGTRPTAERGNKVAWQDSPTECSDEAQRPASSHGQVYPAKKGPPLHLRLYRNQMRAPTALRDCAPLCTRYEWADPLT